MSYTKKTLAILLFILAIFSTKLSATHLVGGQLTYKYLGSSGSFDKYEINMYVYRDCAAANPVLFDDEITMCIYENTGEKPLRASLFMNLKFDRKVQPKGNTNCPEVTSTCLRQGLYTKEVNLPKSNFGYILKWERCCRNTQNNLAELSGGPDQGQTYITNIPPSALKNSSPEFTEVPVPFICVNDTTSMRNFAVDKDGDSLSFHFVIPYQGASTNSAIETICPNYMPANRNVVYNNGYSFLNPFGNGGVAKIDALNGLTTYLSKATGRFAVAIEVREWRAGVLISTVRLDLQILVINCKTNNVPTVSYTSSTADKWYITAGEKLCINVKGGDIDNQNIALTAYGDIFTGANGFKGTKATFTPNPATGFKSATGEFCWKTDCDQYRTTPYLATFEVVDDGCPSKFRNINVEIYVLPFAPTDVPSGPTTVCQNQKNVVYNASQTTAGVTYQWQVTGGTIVGSSTGNSITVDWGNGNTGEVSFTVTSASGCVSQAKKINISLLNAPNKPNILGSDTVCLNATRVFNVTAVAGVTYHWSVVGGTFTAGAGTTDATATVFWNTKGTQKVSVYLRNSAGCTSELDSHVVYVSHPDNTGVTGPNSICPFNKNIAYSSLPTNAGSSYNWTITGGTVSSGQGQGTVYVNWGDKGTGTVTVVETDRLGCLGDPNTLTVIKDHALKGQFPKGDTLLCENSLNIPYSILNVNGETYNWYATGNATIVPPPTTSSVKLNFGLAGTAQVGVQTTAYDSVNNLPCLSPINYIKVLLKPYPKPNPIIGNYNFCQIPTFGVYQITGFANSTYNWQVLNLPFTGNGTNQIQINCDTFGTFTLKVQEISEFGCAGPINDTTIVIHPKPRTSPILGDDIICYPNYFNKNYQVSGFAKSKFNWSLQNGTFFGRKDTNSVYVDWTANPNGKIQVVEISEFGCIGDTQSMIIFADNPSIIADNLTVDPPPNTDKNILFTFQLLNAPRYNNSIYIQRKITGIIGNFITIDAISSNSTSYIDTKAKTDEYSYQYQPVAINLCGDSIFGNQMQDILLTGSKPDPFTSKISFTNFAGWANGVEKYELYRALEGKTPYELYRTYTSPTSDSFVNGTDHYGQWYRIKAYELNGSRVSWSNDIKLYFEPVIYIPNVFSPKATESNNNIFKPSNSGLKTYSLSIYNRWGQEVFTTENPNVGWDGTYLGKDAPAGVYVYYVKYQDFRDKNYATKGSLHLLR